MKIKNLLVTIAVGLFADGVYGEIHLAPPGFNEASPAVSVRSPEFAEFARLAENALKNILPDQASQVLSRLRALEEAVKPLSLKMSEEEIDPSSSILYERHSHVVLNLIAAAPAVLGAKPISQVYFNNEEEKDAFVDIIKSISGDNPDKRLICVVRSGRQLGFEVNVIDAPLAIKIINEAYNYTETPEISKILKESGFWRPKSEYKPELIKNIVKKLLEGLSNGDPRAHIIGLLFGFPPLAVEEYIAEQSANGDRVTAPFQPKWLNAGFITYPSSQNYENIRRESQRICDVWDVCAEMVYDYFSFIHKLTLPIEAIRGLLTVRKDGTPKQRITSAIRPSPVSFSL